jgi:putative ABC transport system permease protein
LRRYKYWLLWPLLNLRHNAWSSAVAVLGTGAAAFLVLTLLGFVRGYEAAVRRDVDRMGYDVLVTAKGCPYEAATLMLRGGVGMRYMPEGVLARIRQDPDTEAVFPMLMHPLRDPMGADAMLLLTGVEPSYAEAQGLRIKEGSWFADGSPGSPGTAGTPRAPLDLVLGYEAAELEQRHAGDPYLLPGPPGTPPLQARVLGILERSGTQLDGTLLLRLPDVQAAYGLGGRLTGVGLRLRKDARARVAEVRDRWDQEPELQAVALSRVVETLRVALDRLREVVRLLALLLAVMAGAVLLNTALLRTLGEHRRMAVLRAIGLPLRFLAAAALVENALLAGAGALLGAAATLALAPLASVRLAAYLPYSPEGNLVALPLPLAAAVLLGALGIGVLAGAPPVLRLRRLNSVLALRED